MKRIPLNHGEFYALVDDEDYKYLSRWTWQASSRRGRFVAYAERTDWNNGKQRRIKMHREIMKALPGVQIDHINGNGLDNRKSNLRLCTHSQNQGNRGPNRKSKTGFKGVRLHTYKDTKFWTVEFQFNKEKIYLGTFSTPRDAATAYNIKAKELWGEFAWLNPL